jgi:O-antigen biosynthesis protein
VAERSISFEPAFPEHMYAPSENAFEQESKQRLFFCSRPRNLRNLFFTELKLLDQALPLGVINRDEWDIILAGSDTRRVVFSDGTEPKILGRLAWADYLEFAKTVDLGLCLMYTPHPSYSPLDLAASGAVVLTNTHANKQSLDHYSKNIVCADMDDESVLKGLKTAIQLSKDANQRRNTFRANQIQWDWERSMQQVLEYMNLHK